MVDYPNAENLRRPLTIALLLIGRGLIGSSISMLQLHSDVPAAGHCLQQQYG
jgi:hypothetical protein